MNRKKIDRQMERFIEGKIYMQRERQIQGKIYIWKNRYMERQIDGNIKRGGYKQMER